MISIKKFKIFTEAGSKVGLGHITRCCALYDEITFRGFDVVIYINGDIDDIKFLREYKVVNYNWLDEEYLKSQIVDNDYCIVDSYLADKKLYEIISQLSKKTLYIDDMNRINYPKGIVVNPSLNTDFLDYGKDDKKEYLLGSEYIILRPFFRQNEKKILSETIERCLVIMGGSDMKNITPRVIEKICNVSRKIKFDVVVGPTFTNVDEIKRVSKENVELHYNLNAKGVKDLMLNVDFAITAAGQTIYELLSVGTPFIPIKIIDNQTNNLIGLKKRNERLNVIDIEEQDWEEELLKEYKFISIYSNRLCFNEKFYGLVDGLGTKRIIDKLIC